VIFFSGSTKEIRAGANIIKLFIHNILIFRGSECLSIANLSSLVLMFVSKAGAYQSGARSGASL
jgi:D-arabinose 5-phosphate isomerase GutQ